jgi:hypothetical protein
MIIFFATPYFFICVLFSPLIPSAQMRSCGRNNVIMPHAVSFFNYPFGNDSHNFSARLQFTANHNCSRGVRENVFLKRYLKQEAIATALVPYTILYSFKKTGSRTPREQQLSKKNTLAIIQ